MTERGPRYDAVAEFYNKGHAAGVDDPPTSALLTLVGDVRGLRVLDLACGQGRVARVLAQRGATVVGIDVSARLIEIASAHEGESPLGITYAVGDAGNRGTLGTNEYNVAVCNMAVTDFDDLSSVMEATARALLPNGVLVLSMLHPCYPGSGVWNSSWPPAGYFKEGFWNTGSDGIRGLVGTNHRTLSTLFNTIISHGLRIEALREPVWERSDRGPTNDQVPGFLVLRVAAGSD